jgi:hypothetical protein
MIEVSIYQNISELSALAGVWDELKKQEPRFFPSFAQAQSFLEAASCDYRFLVAKSNSEIVGIACFLSRLSKKHFTIGKRLLFSFPVRQTVLFGSSILGQLDQATIAEFIRIIIDEFDFDLMSFGEIISDSPLHNAIVNFNRGMIVTRPSRKHSFRWLIKLPATFDEYLISLGSVTRNSVVRKLKKFQRDFQFDFRVVHLPEQIDKFLLEGEAISRTTYQWGIGQRLYNDEPTRKHYTQLAKNGQLRCYMLYINGQPSAFLRGELADNLYYYETPGFDPKFQNASPGIVLLMWAIRDLIENTPCEIFDFGSGGSDNDYKSHFGNLCINCMSLELGNKYKPYSLLLVSLQETLSLAKNMTSAAIGNGTLRRWVKKNIQIRSNKQ